MLAVTANSPESGSGECNPNACCRGSGIGAGAAGTGTLVASGVGEGTAGGVLAVVGATVGPGGALLQAAASASSSPRAMANGGAN